MNNQHPHLGRPPQKLDLRKHNGQSSPLQTHKPSQSHRPRQPSRLSLRRILGILLIVAAGILLGVAVYTSTLLLTPRIYKKSVEQIKQAVATSPNGNWLFIPSVGVSAEIAEGDIRILDQGKVWHRNAYEGDPRSGGNTILTGHSFVWGYTPKRVKDQSIFYNLGEAKVGDEVTVRWNGKNYNYKVSQVKTVKPNEISIEQSTKDTQLTIYTCTLGGSADGRVVVIARPE